FSRDPNLLHDDLICVGNQLFYFDFRNACDAPAEVFQQWYQSQARTARRRGWPWLAARGSRLRPRPSARGRLAIANTPLQGRSVATKAPCKGLADHLQGAAARRGNSPQGAATHGRGCQRRACKGQLPAASPQEAAHGAPARGCRQQGRQRRPQGWLPLSRAIANHNAQCHCLRRGSDDDDGAGG
ncbi:hypothetical protein GW17_00061332, partial [Ensete ventricosum]